MLTKTKNEDNIPINGIKKTQHGSLVVDDLNAYNKYKREKQLLQRVLTLEHQMAVLMSKYDQSNNGINNVS